MLGFRLAAKRLSEGLKTITKRQKLNQRGFLSKASQPDPRMKHEFHKARELFGMSRPDNALEILQKIERDLDPS